MAKDEGQASSEEESGPKKANSTKDKKDSKNGEKEESRTEEAMSLGQISKIASKITATKNDGLQPLHTVRMGRGGGFCMSVGVSVGGDRKWFNPYSIGDHKRCTFESETQ